MDRQTQIIIDNKNAYINFIKDHSELIKITSKTFNNRKEAYDAIDKFVTIMRNKYNINSDYFKCVDAIFEDEDFEKDYNAYHG